MHRPRKNGDKIEVLYTCPKCRYNVWGKSGLQISCGECRVPLHVLTQSRQLRGNLKRKSPA